tara:strand:+ start:1752 stop:2438 length:687 start_codon:yes stop_codon:yes gene_type:complete
MIHLKKIIPKGIKKFIKNFLFRKAPKKKGFHGSKLYWEERYVSNRNSGPGSYGRLAEFKAEILNSFVAKNNIQTIIEYGCGDGNQLSLSVYPNYLGYDISKKAVAICIEKFAGDETKKFEVISTNTVYKNAEVALSLDVIFHLVEDSVFNEYMLRLFNTATEYVIIYSSNYEASIAAHVRCRKFTDWISTHVSDNWSLHQKIDNPYPMHEDDPDNTSFADFYIYKKNQ